MNCCSEELKKLNSDLRDLNDSVSSEINLEPIRYDLVNLLISLLKIRSSYKGLKDDIESLIGNLFKSARIEGHRLWFYKDNGESICSVLLPDENTYINSGTLTNGNIVLGYNTDLPNITITLPALVTNIVLNGSILTISYTKGENSTITMPSDTFIVNGTVARDLENDNHFTLYLVRSDDITIPIDLNPIIVEIPLSPGYYFSSVKYTPSKTFAERDVKFGSLGTILYIGVDLIEFPYDLEDHRYIFEIKNNNNYRFVLEYRMPEPDTIYFVSTGSTSYTKDGVLRTYPYGEIAFFFKLGDEFVLKSTGIIGPNYIDANNNIVKTAYALAFTKAFPRYGDFFMSELLTTGDDATNPNECGRYETESNVNDIPFDFKRIYNETLEVKNIKYYYDDGERPNSLYQYSYLKKFSSKYPYLWKTTKDILKYGTDENGIELSFNYVYNDKSKFLNIAILSSYELPESYPIRFGTSVRNKIIDLSSYAGTLTYTKLFNNLNYEDLIWDKNTNTYKNSLNLLVLGNSYSLDAFRYFPFIIQEIYKLKTGNELSLDITILYRANTGIGFLQGPPVPDNNNPIGWYDMSESDNDDVWFGSAINLGGWKFSSNPNINGYNKWIGFGHASTVASSSISLLKNICGISEHGKTIGIKWDYVVFHLRSIYSDDPNSLYNDDKSINYLLTICNRFLLLINRSQIVITRVNDNDIASFTDPVLLSKFSGYLNILNADSDTIKLELAPYTCKFAWMITPSKETATELQQSINAEIDTLNDHVMYYKYNNKAYGIILTTKEVLGFNVNSSVNKLINLLLPCGTAILKAKHTILNNINGNALNYLDHLLPGIALYIEGYVIAISLIGDCNLNIDISQRLSNLTWTNTLLVLRASDVGMDNEDYLLLARLIARDAVMDPFLSKVTEKIDANETPEESDWLSHDGNYTYVGQAYVNNSITVQDILETKYSGETVDSGIINIFDKNCWEDWRLNYIWSYLLSVFLSTTTNNSGSDCIPYYRVFKESVGWNTKYSNWTFIGLGNNIKFFQTLPNNAYNSNLTILTTVPTIDFDFLMNDIRIYGSVQIQIEDFGTTINGNDYGLTRKNTNYIKEYTYIMPNIKILSGLVMYLDNTDTYTVTIQTESNTPDLDSFIPVGDTTLDVPMGYEEILNG